MEFDNLNDVLEFALEKEDASYRLYRNAAAKSPSPASRKMFEEMAEEEAGHKRMIQKMDREKVASYTFKRYPDLKLDELLADVPYRDDMSYQEILIFSIKEEERSYRLYREAEAMADDPEIKRLLLMLANEEKKHKYHLEKLYDEKVLTEM